MAWVERARWSGVGSRQPGARRCPRRSLVSGGSGSGVSAVGCRGRAGLCRPSSRRRGRCSRYRHWARGRRRSAHVERCSVIANVISPPHHRCPGSARAAALTQATGSVFPAVATGRFGGVQPVRGAARRCASSTSVRRRRYRPVRAACATQVPVLLVRHRTAPESVAFSPSALLVANAQSGARTASVSSVRSARRSHAGRWVAVRAWHTSLARWRLARRGRCSRPLTGRPYGVGVPGRFGRRSHPGVGVAVATARSEWVAFSPSGRCSPPRMTGEYGIGVFGRFGRRSHSGRGVAVCDGHGAEVGGV